MPRPAKKPKSAPALAADPPNTEQTVAPEEPEQTVAPDEPEQTVAPEEPACECDTSEESPPRKVRATDERGDKKPKRPLNAFMLFSKEQRASFDRSTKVTEVAKEIGCRWRDLPEEERGRYKQMALELRAAA